jgi:hypothetical protein
MAVVNPPLGFSPPQPAEAHSAETLASSRLIITAGLDAGGLPAIQERWVFDAEVDVKDLLTLDEGWDGDVADPVAIAAVENALRLIRAFDQAGLAEQLPRPRILPTVNGGVAIAWSSPVARVEFEVDDTGDIRALAVGPERDIDTTDVDEAGPAFGMLHHFMPAE